MNSIISRHILRLLILALPGANAVLATPIELTRDQGSEHVIYYGEAAPLSVVMAASELQEYLHKVSGAKLAIVRQPHPPMICLGDNAASREAGLSVDNIPLEGFRIVTQGRQYLYSGPRYGGRATHHWRRYIPAGTRNGTYAFIERFLGVRWLVPGEHGDYVPKSTSITVPETDLVDAPFFLNRRVPYTQQGRREVKRWWARQRLGWSLYLNHSHNWRHTIPASHFDEHPEWFPERGGVRVPPTGRYKLCTTNPELVRAYADATIAYFDRNPNATCYSLSPSDSAGYCECEKCSALYETDPNGNRSVTPAILTFYNDVARLVASKYPDKTVGRIRLCRVCISAARTDSARAERFPRLGPELRLWLHALSSRAAAPMGGSAAPVDEHHRKYLLLRPSDTRLDGSRGSESSGPEDSQVHLPAFESRERQWACTFMASRPGGAELRSTTCWHELAWNPDADVEALFDEFCEKAYGRGGDDIKQMYRMLDAEMERHFLQYPDVRYRLTPDMMREIYAKNLEEIERLYRAAESKVEDVDARARLEMIGDNLTVLHWNLRQLRMLDDPRQSSFYLSDADFFSFLSDNEGSLALQPTTATVAPSYVRKGLNVASDAELSGAEQVEPFRLRGDQHLVILPTGNRPVQVKFSRISARGELVTYRVYEADGQEIASGLMSARGADRTDAGEFSILSSGYIGRHSFVYGGGHQCRMGG